jgi:hypothetical protein
LLLRANPYFRALQDYTFGTMSLLYPSCNPWDGCYLAMHCLPLHITNRYFILREWVHQLQWPGAGQHWSCVTGRQGWKAVGVANESTNWVQVPMWQFYLSHIGIWST